MTTAARSGHCYRLSRETSYPLLTVRGTGNEVVMRHTVACLILISVSLSAGSQLILKLGITAPEVQRALAEGPSIPRVALAIASSPLVIAGLGCFGLSAMFWLFVLAKLDASLAYPCVALGIVITVCAGHFLLGETVSALRVAGIAIIVAGVLIVAVGD